MHDYGSAGLMRKLALLPAAVAMGASGQVDIPDLSTFSPLHYSAPMFPQALAVTDEEFDLVGATDDEPDGYPELAVAGKENGLIRIYRNISTTTMYNDVALSQLFFADIDAIGQLVSDGAMTTDEAETAYIEDIKFAQMTTPDLDPDLLVAISYEDDDGYLRGKLVHYRANRDPFTLVVTDYSLFSAVHLDYPATGIAVTDFTLDNHSDVVVACQESFAVGSNATRIHKVRNDYDSMVGSYGVLNHIGDEQPTSPGGISTSNVVAGDFSGLVSGGIGGGSGNTRDYLAFGGPSSTGPVQDGLVLGVGNNSGPYGFSTVNLSNPVCGTISYGLGNGSAESGASALVAFDPFANRDQSFATTNGDDVAIIHNKPLNGVFYHLCDGNATTDFYDMHNGTEAQPGTYIARGNLNGDAFDDLVFINATEEEFAVLLGLGSPDVNNKIMQFDNTNSDYYRTYAPQGGTDYDRVICSDLNLDGDDDIIITRHYYWGTSGGFQIVIFQNSGDVLP